MKYAVILAFLAILASLGTALFFMMRQGRAHPSSKGKHMATALAVRVGLSVVLFLCILIAWQMGWIQPSGLPVSAG